MNDVILQKIRKEIEGKYNCRVVSIGYFKLISLCIIANIQFNDDIQYQPGWLKYFSIESLCFSEKSIRVIRRVDLFDCVKENSNLN
jgi:hypothetical protein